MLLHRKIITLNLFFGFNLNYSSRSNLNFSEDQFVVVALLPFTGNPCTEFGKMFLPSSHPAGLQQLLLKMPSCHFSREISAVSNPYQF